MPGGGFVRIRALLWFFLVAVAATSQAFQATATPEEQYREAMSLLLVNYDQADVNAAMRLLAISADRGYPPAQTAMGTVYEQGFGVTPDIRRAADWYKKAAEQGDWVAQFSLGRIYLQGSAFQRDFAEARKWLEMAAADPRDCGASFLLGALYEDRQSIHVDYKLAAKWYRVSAERGNPFAMERLGMMLLRGDAGGIGTQYKEEGYVLLLVAAELGNQHVYQQLGSMQFDIGKTASDAVRRRALDMRDRILDYTQQACGAWDEQYSSDPAPPPLSLQMQCLQGPPLGRLR